MDLIALPVLTDNIAWLLVEPRARLAAVVDPGAAAPVAAAVAARGLVLAAILVTHHHHDHIGGVGELAAAARAAGRPLRIYAGADEADRVPGTTDALADGDAIDLFGTQVRVLATPGHTRGAVTFVCAAGPWAFTGDTLFLGGCGRLFEGDAATLHASLSRLAALPPATLVCCGHEYTERNYSFVASLLPSDAAVARRLAAVRAQRRRGELSVPAPLADELATNPFLFPGADAVVTGLGMPAGIDPGVSFAALRRRRDAF